MRSTQIKKLPKDGMNKILIRGTNWIGDAIMTLPAVASIRATYPQAHIALLAKQWVADIYKLFSELDEIIIYEKKFDTPTGVFRLAKKLKKENFDAAILLQNAIEAAIIARVAGIPLRAGYDSDARGFLLTHRVRRTQKIKNVHQTEYYLEMVISLGCAPIAREMHLETKINPIVVRKVLKKFIPETKKNLIGIAPGATYGAAKKWFPERFAQLTDRLAGAFFGQTIILGGNDDKKTAQEIDELSDAPLINLAGKTTLTEAAYLISQCSLFISNDSGLMHIAGALNIPTIAIFGSTNPVTTSPLGSQSVIIRKEVSCSPCLKETCPTDFRCMKLISVEDVFSVAQKLMQEKRSENR